MNVGTEQEKGKATLQGVRISKEKLSGKEFTGFVEGNEITNGVVDVVVTDGFSGNIALKTAEGIAKLCSVYIKKMFSDTFGKSILLFN